MYENGPGLKKVVNLEIWQKVQNSFSEVLGITLKTVDADGAELTEKSGPYLLYSKIPSDLPEYSEFCGGCPLKTGLRQASNIKEETHFKCPFDLDIFILPIKVFRRRVVGHIIVGPVILNKRKDKAEYVKLARKIGIDPDEVVDALIEVNVFTYNSVRSIIALLRDVFSFMAQTGYHKKRLGEIAHVVTEMDPLFSSYYEENILNALLNTCTVAFDADSGSVMTVDKDSRNLRIKAASRLDEKVVNDTNLKLGEGIAGLAAATAEPIILPKDRNKNGISKKMKRGYIKSSMIVPFNKADEDKVYGVINLNIVRKNKEFSGKDISLIKELINLTSLALVPVK